MEEPKTAQTTPPLSDSNPPPSSTAQTLLPQPSPPPPPSTTLPPQPPPPPPPTTATSTLPPKSKKRSREYDALLKNSNYIKMRAVIKDLRPHFIEVLKTPDFRNCKAAHEIREQMKILMESYKHMKADVISQKSSVPDSQPSSGENLNGKKLQDAKSHEQSQTDRAFGKPYENKPTSQTVYEKLAEDSHSHGTYVVGGSAFGWNFITYKGEEPVYYGRTKEQFRATLTPKPDNLDSSAVDAQHSQ
ncbi:hypothetical protein L6164_003869 [Bauhinia variegata]|uniref:Uncharacterized protein n=1 Tax=Bauhinia variegata TaxID=167791 RepID=A0ACB9Q861_BAUVA|nr:hypothetical protein L6164_003869 [Bauhinia variegata]